MKAQESKIKLETVEPTPSSLNRRDESGEPNYRQIYANE